MNRSEVEKLEPGDKVLPLIGPFKDRAATVTKVELNAGAWNGWVTVRFPDGMAGMYAGEEIKAYSEGIPWIKGALSLPPISARTSPYNHLPEEGQPEIGNTGNCEDNKSEWRGYKAHQNEEGFED